MDMKQGYRLDVSHDPKKPFGHDQSSAAADLSGCVAACFDGEDRQPRHRPTRRPCQRLLDMGQGERADAADALGQVMGPDRAIARTGVRRHIRPGRECERVLERTFDLSQNTEGLQRLGDGGRRRPIHGAV